MELPASTLSQAKIAAVKTAADERDASSNTFAKELENQKFPDSVHNSDIQNLSKPKLDQIESQNSENNSLSDKEFKAEDEHHDLNNIFFSLMHKVEGLSTYVSLIVNSISSVLMQLNLSDGLKRTFAKFTDVATNMSFIPYGLDGIRIGAAKKNPYQSLGYLLELTTVWLSDLKTKYLIRGLGTGIDQIWVATDAKLKETRGIEEGRFKNWYEGLIEVPLASWEMLKEIAKDPIGTIFTKNSKGHKALLSSIGDGISTIGYAITGQEKFFGGLRDVAGMLFDAEMLFKDKLIEKLSGCLFITESCIDYLARFAKTEWARLTLNMLAHATGRAALMCYKNSDPNANKEKEHVLDFKKPLAPISKLKSSKKTHIQDIPASVLAV